jgi:hypothetical protein
VPNSQRFEPAKTDKARRDDASAGAKDAPH